MAKDYFTKPSDTSDAPIDGPFTAAQIKQMAANGSLPRTALVSTDQAKWMAAGKIKGLQFADEELVLDDSEPRQATTSVPPPSLPTTPPSIPTIESAIPSPRANDSGEPVTTPHQSRCDILISYRRKGGSEIARFVAESLRRDGFRVFLDVDGLGGGSWSAELEQRIAECKDFVPIISEGFFDRCSDPNDVVRKELVHALENEKNIVPLLCCDNAFPSELPNDIAKLSSYNGVRYVHDYAPKAIEKLTSMLVSRAGGPERLYSGEAEPRVIFAVVGMFFAAWQGADMGLIAGQGPMIEVGMWTALMQGLFWGLGILVLFVLPAVLLISFISAATKIRSDRLYAGPWIPFWIVTLPLITAVTSLVVVGIFSTLGIQSYFWGGVVGQITGLTYVFIAIKTKAWTPVGDMIAAMRK